MTDPESCFGRNVYDNIALLLEKARNSTKAVDLKSNDDDNNTKIHTVDTATVRGSIDEGPPTGPGPKDDKANVNVSTNADVIEKPMLQNGPNYSVCSGGRSKDDMASLERDETKRVDHEVDTEIQNKEENGEDHKNERERPAEEEDASNNNSGNTYSTTSVKKATTGNYGKKCEVNFDSKKNFRRHLIESHETDAYGKCDAETKHDCCTNRKLKTEKSGGRKTF